METVKKRKQPHFPRYESKSGIAGFFTFLVGLCLWALLIFMFLFSAYTDWFSRSLEKILYRIKKGKYNVPFWFSAILVIFIFPLTLVLILTNEFLKIAKI